MTPLEAEKALKALEGAVPPWMPETQVPKWVLGYLIIKYFGALP